MVYPNLSISLKVIWNTIFIDPSLLALVISLPSPVEITFGAFIISALWPAIIPTILRITELVIGENI